MDTTSLFSALSLSVVGFLILSLVAVGLAAMRREYGESAGGVGVLFVLVLGVCAFVMLMGALVRVRKMAEPHRVSQKFETVTCHLVGRDIT